jgi:hypothetical protein
MMRSVLKRMLKRMLRRRKSERWSFVCCEKREGSYNGSDESLAGQISALYG